MATLNRADIIGKQLKTQSVAVPEWGGDVVVREISAGERAAFEAWCGSRKDEAGGFDGLRERIVVLSCIDEFGAPLFTQDDIPALRDLSGSALGRLADAALDLSGMSDKASKDAEKN